MYGLEYAVETPRFFGLLRKILDKYQSSVMDYAFWYRENYPGDKDYSSYITLRTCHCIVHSQFFSSQNSRDIVKF